MIYNYTCDKLNLFISDLVIFITLDFVNWGPLLMIYWHFCEDIFL